ncbi:unnamed protein product [Nezara viridula]|uniref:C2H2-type domain-containing protein n=1 Tax=Nezara viridula TaxID=85310 RepID=A0A9P0HI61_NEZVI|nr:unnamed protein product [Nezara viridula]
MTLPMVTCPLCCQPGFNSSDSLCSALINVTTRKLCCPICNYVVVGLDKFTIHLFSHSLNKYGMEHIRDSVLLCQSNNANLVSSRSIPCNNNSFEAEPLNSPNLSNSLIKLQHNANQDSDLNSVDKREWKMEMNNQNSLQKSLNIPDTSLICFRSDSGQLFTISTEGMGTTLKNVTINTQNYITNTNITTSTVQTSMTEKVQKRKYSQVFEKDQIETGNVFDQKSPDVESINSWPSTPSVLSESEKQTGCNFPEREFESCKDLLTKGDFSTLCDDVNETDMKKDSHSPNKIDPEENHESLAKKNDLIKKDCLNCELCPYTFPNKTILAMHKQLIHKKVDSDVENKQKLLLCNLCPRTFNLRSSLMIHRRVAHAGGFGNSESDNSKQPHTKPACNICGKFFKKEIHLSQHMKAHDEKQWQCTICSKTFTTKYFLKKHRRLHTGETPYKCNTCSKSFTFQQSYHKHLLYHNDEKPYCCAQCGRLFKELSTLHNHERIHSGEKPFSCETCDFTIYFVLTNTQHITVCVHVCVFF